MALIDDLEKEGFDTSQITPELVSSLEKEGYDTSGLKRPETPSLSEGPKESKARSFTRKVAKALPVAGATAGGIALGIPGTVFGMGVGGVPSAAVGAGIGGAGGEAMKQLILRSLGDTEGVPQTSGEAAKDIGIEGGKQAAITYFGGKALQGVGKGAMLAKDLITKPGAGEVALAGKEALMDVASRGAEKYALAQATKEAAKKGLIDAEEKAGLHFLSTSEFEKAIADPKRVAKVAESLGRLANKTPEELSQLLSPEQLQNARKFAQEAEKVTGLSDIAKSHLRFGKNQFAEALGKLKPEVGEQLSRFREADKVVGEIPGQTRELLAKTKLKNAADLLDARNLDKKRRIAKGVAATVGGYLGVKSLLK